MPRQIQYKHFQRAGLARKHSGQFFEKESSPAAHRRGTPDLNQVPAPMQVRWTVRRCNLEKVDAESSADHRGAPEASLSGAGVGDGIGSSTVSFFIQGFPSQILGGNGF